MAISVTKPTSTPKDFFSFFLSTFNDGSIRQMARDTRFIVRSRKMHPELFVRSLVAACSQDKEFSLSSIYQDYRRRCIENDCECMSWEPFYDFLQKPSFIKFVEALLNVANDAAGRATIAGTNKLVETLKTRLPKLKDIILQDGTEISTNCDKYKGTRDPQIKIHRTLSMQSMAEYRCSITSGIKSERGEIRLKALKNRLLIADAGYPAFKLFGRIVKNGGWFLIKLRSNCTLPVISSMVVSKDGKLIREECMVGKERRHARSRVSSSQFQDGRIHDFTVQSDPRKEQPESVTFRIVKVYLDKDEVTDGDPSVKWETYQDNKGIAHRRYFVLLATNLPADVADAIQLAELYRARWSVEISFRMLKGFCGCKRTLTKDPVLAKALVLVSELVYHLKLLFMQQTEKLTGKALSPKKFFHYCSHLLILLLEHLNQRRIAMRLLRQLGQLAQDWTKSTCSCINRLRGKSLDLVVAKLAIAPMEVPDL